MIETRPKMVSKIRKPEDCKPNWMYCRNCNVTLRAQRDEVCPRCYGPLERGLCDRRGDLRPEFRCK